jgi:hypothetical protein
MSRPKKSEARSARLNLSLTPNEFESIKRRALALGMRVAHFGRAVLLDPKNVTTVKSEAQRESADRLVHIQLARLGNILNQMVRHLHQTGDPLPADLEPLLTDIRAILARRGHDDR